jgi:multiple sugar transport system ATP-binding protein
MSSIALQNVHKLWPNGHAAVRDVTLTVAQGELLVVVGPSGCGKSTVLRLIAGLETPSRGDILIDGRVVTPLPPQERNIAMVFQNYALYPHKTVRQNLAFGLRMRSTNRSETAERVSRVAGMLGLQHLLDRRPAQLSGGQRQRVALGRAIAREADAFLLDEPLSNLDPRLRGETRAELALLHRRLGATMLYVTHDQEEAMTLGTRVAVMREGSVEQLAPPLQVYQRPVNAFVAGFVGSPAMNLIPVSANGGGEPHWTTAALPADLRGRAMPRNGNVLIGIRPHDIEAVSPSDQDVAGRVLVIEQLGATSLLHAEVPGTMLRVVVPSDRRVAIDDTIPLRLRKDRLHLFDAESGRRLGGES